MALRLAIDCLCGAVAQNVTTSSTSDSSVVPLALCHCTACRHSSGLLCTSYCPIEPPAAADHILASLSAYASSAAVTRYFCRTCGCHVFRRDRGADEIVQWQVATGVIVEEIGDAASSDRPATLAFVRHDHVTDTQDGGLAV
ncbi:duf636 domain containing protein [Grosmannia clavigera kw1407]|uniref:Duf636 domain containing protein n=1 Tax=Grosmannia clavigera (strain kw1407 / UAMH 11150) TaxID=655863 RepID=F0XBT9_GROCL|nr:duf636 domain containing protein [Grosmannia clavigera kw1407]EFX04835.1 duf636 domain containing protein [Grosmannia clavigera kw1407]